MQQQLRQLFRLQDNEAVLVLVLGFLLLSNALTMQISYTFSLSGFLNSSGVASMLAVWIINALLSLLITASQSLFIDRFDRKTLMKAVVLGFAGVFVLLRLLFWLDAPAWLVFGLFYITAEQQWLIFPLIFWVLANDVVNVAQAKRLFPLFATGAFVGRIVGLVFAALAPQFFNRLGWPLENLTLFNMSFYVLAYVVLWRNQRKIVTRASSQRRESWRDTLSEGWHFIRDVPSFRYLSLAILGLFVCDTIIEFRFLNVSSRNFASTESYQTFYSLYRLSTVILGFLLQAFATSRLLERLQIKGALLVFPLTLVLGLAWMLAIPGLFSAVGAMMLFKLANSTINESALKAFQGLVPEERRGRVSMFMDSYLVSLGTMTASLLMALTLGLASWLRIEQAHYLYLSLGLLIAIGALVAVLRMRKVYDSSLLNWRLKRRQRRGSAALDKLM